MAGIRVVTAALAGENIKYVTRVSTGSQQSAQHHVIFVACLEIMYCDCSLRAALRQPAAPVRVLHADDRGVDPHHRHLLLPAHLGLLPGPRHPRQPPARPRPAPRRHRHVRGTRARRRARVPAAGS